jgi:hypothetical protein
MSKVACRSGAVVQSILVIMKVCPGCYEYIVKVSSRNLVLGDREGKAQVCIEGPKRNRLLVLFLQ